MSHSGSQIGDQRMVAGAKSGSPSVVNPCWAEWTCHDVGERFVPCRGQTYIASAGSGGILLLAELPKAQRSHLG